MSPADPFLPSAGPLSMGTKVLKQAALRSTKETRKRLEEEGNRETGRVLRGTPLELAQLLWRTTQGSTVALSPDAYNALMRSKDTNYFHAHPADEESEARRGERTWHQAATLRHALLITAMREAKSLSRQRL